MEFGRICLIPDQLFLTCLLLTSLFMTIFTTKKRYHGYVICYYIQKDKIQARLTELETAPYCTTLKNTVVNRLTEYIK